MAGRNRRSLGGKHLDLDWHLDAPLVISANAYRQIAVVIRHLSDNQRRERQQDQNEFDGLGDKSSAPQQSLAANVFAVLVGCADRGS